MYIKLLYSFTAIIYFNCSKIYCRAGNSSTLLNTSSGCPFVVLAGLSPACGLPLPSRRYSTSSPLPPFHYILNICTNICITTNINSCLIKFLQHTFTPTTFIQSQEIFHLRKTEKFLIPDCINEPTTQTLLLPLSK